MVSPGAAGAQDIAKQVEMEGLIEKLASAAVAVRKLEEMAKKGQPYFYFVL